MKLKTFTLRTNLLSKLLLSLALLIGSADVWAETVIVNGTSVSTGWTPSNYTASEGYISPYNYAGFTITSDAKVTIGSNTKVIIQGKRTNSSSVSFVISSSADGSSYTDKQTFGYKLFDTDNDVEIISDDLEEGEYYLKFTGKYISVNSIIITDDDVEYLLTQEKQTIMQPGTKTIRFDYTPASGWNTICVPFQLKKTYSGPFDHMETIFGSGYKVYSIYSYSSNTLTFSENKYSISQNVPCLVYIETPASNPGGIVLSDVSLSFVAASNRRASSSPAVFQGTYAPITAGNFTSSMYGVTSSGQVRPGDGVNARMKGYRAYFTGVTAPGAEVKMIVIDDEGGTTDLGFVKMVDENAKEVYNLAGQKVQKGRKGIYIVNGKKVVIK